MTPDDLKAWRKRLTLTQEEAGEAIGMTKSAVQKMEAGAVAIPYRTELSCFAVAVLRSPLLFQVEGFEHLHEAEKARRHFAASQ